MDNELYCTRFKGIAYTKDIPDKIALVRLRCKMWDCEYCSKKNRAIWFMHLQKRLPEISSDWHFVTLTAHSHSHESGKTLEACQRGVDLLLKRIRWLSKVSYVRVYEKHESGAIHAHLIIHGLPDRVYYEIAKNGGKKWSTGLPSNWHAPLKIHRWAIKSWLKKSSQEVGMGYIVDIQKIAGDVNKAINYVLKYMSKDLQSGFDKKGLRRIATSQDVGSPKPESEYTWHLTNHITPMDLALAARDKREIYDLSTNHRVTLDDFEFVNVYPPELQ